MSIFGFRLGDSCNLEGQVVKKAVEPVDYK